MTSLARTVAHQLANRDRLTIGRTTVKLIVFVLAFATWVAMMKGRWDVTEQIGVSIVVLVGFLAFTSAVHDILQASFLGGRQTLEARPVDDRHAGARGGPLADDPETLASILVTYTPTTRGTLTLGDATRTLVQQVGPLPMDRVLRALDVLTRVQWCAPDFDEATEQRCWRVASAPPRVEDPDRAARQLVS